MTTIRVGDEVLMRDWRTGESFGVWSRVTRIVVRDKPVDRVTEAENRSVAFVVVTVDHTWVVPRGSWGHDVLGVRVTEWRT